MSGSDIISGGSVGFGKRSIHKPGPTDVALKMEVQLLRGVLEAVLLASAQGENINLEHPEIRKLMGVSPEASSEEIRRKLMQSRSPVLGRVDCGNCGGAVQQREGVDTVECHWCGSTVEFGYAELPTQEQKPLGDED